MKAIILSAILILFFNCDLKAQADTLFTLDVKMIKAQLKEGTSQYLIFFQNKKKAKQAGTFLTTQSVRFTTLHGIEAIAIEQKTYSSDTSAYFYEYSLVNRTTFNPIHYRLWTQRSGLQAYDFYRDKVVASDTVANNSSKKDYVCAIQKPLLNWNLDLVTFPLLNLKMGKRYYINFYQPGSPKEAQLYEYKIVGEESLKGNDGQTVDCWKLNITYTETNKATFYISKRTKEVIKLVEDFGSGIRYKVRLPGDLSIL